MIDDGNDNDNGTGCASDASVRDGAVGAAEVARAVGAAEVADVAGAAGAAEAAGAAGVVRDAYVIRPVARIRTQFPTKFGVPRQSGLVESLTGTVVFEPEFRDPDALRGIERFSHLWLIWGFDQARRKDGGWAPTVRPPRLGGNAKMGVFATRSPFRPNSLGLSVVALDGAERTDQDGTVLHVRGADLVDGTPIYDVKPYVPYADAVPQAAGGFSAPRDQGRLRVACPPDVRERLGDEAQALVDVLACDPRPAFHDDSQRVYGLPFSRWDVKFRVADGVCTVLAADDVPERGA